VKKGRETSGDAVTALSLFAGLSLCVCIGLFLLPSVYIFSGLRFAYYFFFLSSLLTSPIFIKLTLFL
jgi:hypothetical protein